MQQLPHNLKALLIDFDGTLADSMHALWVCYEAFLEQYGAVATKEEFHSLVGPSLPEIIETLKKVHQISEHPTVLLENYEARLAAAYSEHISFFPETLSVLNKAKSKQLKLVIVTSAPLHLLELFLARNGSLELFDLLITYSEQYSSKPSPAPYAKALSILEITPDEAIAIEDSKNGVKSAFAADLYVIQLGGMIFPGASSVVHSWAEIALILNLE